MTVKFARPLAKICLLLTVLASLAPIGAKPILAQDYVEEFADLAGKAAAHFGNTVAVYEIWNEEDQSSGSAVGLEPEYYARLLGAAYNAIKARSNSQVIVGGLASGDTSYLTKVVAAQGGTLKADGVGLHPYAQYDSAAMRAVLNNYLGVSQGKPLWITEFGWGTPNQGEQATYLEMAIGTFREFGSSVRVPTWYCWSDRMSAYLGESFGLIDPLGGQKESYRMFQRVAQGAGVNIDIELVHSKPHGSPTAADLKNAGVGWVRIVYRPKMDYDFDSLIRSYKNAGINIILVLNQETLWTKDLPTGSAGGRPCLPAISPYMVASDPKITPNAIKETIACTGIWSVWPLKAYCEIYAAFKNIVDAVFQYRESDARSPTSVFRMQKWLLREVEGEREYDGIVARMLPPGYRQDGYDVKTRLIKSEGQMSAGTVITNDGPQPLPDITNGHYDLKGGYEVSALFPDVPALFNKSALIRQTFVPGASKATIPFCECEEDEEESRKIVFKESSRRGVAWEGGEAGKSTEVDSEPLDPSDPDCNSIPDEEGEDGHCAGQSTQIAAAGALKVQTKVALTSESWANIAGGEGMLDIFKPPGGFKFSRSSTEVELPFTYESFSAGSTKGSAKASIRDLGGAVNAFNCITDQLLMPPSTAKKGLCEAVITEAEYGACTEPPECYGTPESQPGCPDCSGDYDHEITPACALGIEPDSGGAMLFCYGNSCRSCATSSAIPSPQGCCGSGYTLPGASCANPAGGWWIGGDQFPGGRVLYNGYTYDIDELSDGAPFLGVYVCDANVFACNNAICGGKGTPLPKKEKTSSQPQVRSAQSSGGRNIWATLGNFIGGIFRTILRP